jgi:hypothetical protein
MYEEYLTVLCLNLKESYGILNELIKL